MTGHRNLAFYIGNAFFKVVLRKKNLQEPSKLESEELRDMGRQEEDLIIIKT